MVPSKVITLPKLPHYPIAEIKEDAEVKKYLDQGYRITSVGGVGRVTVCLVKDAVDK